MNINEKEILMQKYKKKNKIMSIFLTIFYVFIFGCFAFIGYMKWDDMETFHIFDNEISLNTNNEYEIITFGTNQKKVNHYIYFSDNNEIASVSDDGKISAINEGETYITIKSKYSKKYQTILVNVQGDVVNTINFKKNSIEIVKGKIKKLDAIVNNNEKFKADLEWKSDDKKIATVDEEGNVKGLKKGTTYITCTVKGTKVSAKAKVKVIETSNESNTQGEIDNNIKNDKFDDSLASYINVKSIKINEVSNPTISINKSLNLSYKIQPTNATIKDVSWSSNNEKVATVDKNGKVTGVSEGTAEIIVKTKEGYKTDFITIKVIKNEIKVEGIKLNKSDTTISIGNTETLIAVITPSGATSQQVTWTSSNTKVATVDQSGKVTGVSAGSATITATTKDGNKKSTCAVTVSNIKVEGVKINKTSTSILKGSKEQLSAIITPSNATNQQVTWTSNNEKVATVDQNGLVTGISVGNAIITATTKDGNKKSTCAVTVSSLVVSVENIKLNKSDTTISIGNTETLTAVITPNDAVNQQVTWTSSNAKVATVDQSGKVTGVSAGSATITATSEDGNKKSTCAVTVSNIKVEGVKINKTSTSILKGSKEQLSAIITPSNATNQQVTWMSSNTKVATVDQNGLVMGVSAGSATITVTSKDGSRQGTCKIEVKNQSVSVTNIKLNKAKTTIVIGNKETLISTITPSNATNQQVTWTSSNTKVATVDQSGKVTGVSAGSATITATTKDGNKKSTCAVTVSNIKVEGVKINKISTSILKGSKEQLSAIITPSNATNQQVTWTSSNAKVATVDQSGKVTGVSAGSATITATTKDGNKKSTCAVTVINPVISVTNIKLNKTKTTITAGKTETLTVTITPSNATNQQVTWTSSNAKVATVDQSGKVTGVSAGSVTITATSKDGNKKSTCTVTVTNPVISVTNIKLNKTKTTITAGKTETLTITITPSNATNQQVTWTSSNTKVATVDQSGKVTGVSEGSATITATSKDGNKKSTCTVTVTKASIKISSISFKNTNTNLKINDTLSLTTTVTPSNSTNQQLTWSSNNTKVATVDKNGKVTGVSAGSATIKAKATDGSDKVASINIEVKATTIADFQKAFQETAWAYYMRGTRIQYNSAKGNTVWFSPEEATGKNMNYLVCAAFAKNVYNELLGVKIPQYTENHLNYAKRYQGKRKEVIAYGEKSGNDYIIKYYKDGKLEGNPETLKKAVTTPTTKTNLLKHLEIGDVITFTGHTVVVYDFKYDSKGNKVDAYILESTHNGSKNISTKIPNGEATIDGYTIGNDNPHLLYLNQRKTDSNLLKGRPEKEINEGSLRFNLLSVSNFWRYLMNNPEADKKLNLNRSFSIIRVVTANNKGLVYNFIENNEEAKESDSSERVYHNNEQVEISNSSKQRIKFNNIYIEKIANISSIGSVNKGSSITYTITIRNNSNKDYTNNIEVIEKIDKNVKYSNLNEGKGCGKITNGELKCNIANLKAGSEVKIKYTVKVTGEYGKKITSKGTVAGIPSSTIVTKIQKELNNSQKDKIKSYYNLNKNKYKGLELINNIYYNACGIDLGLTNFDITKLVVNKDLSNTSGGSKSIFLCSENNKNDSKCQSKFYNIVLNNYWNTLKFKQYSSKVYDYDMKTWNYNSKNDTQYNWNELSRADTIYEGDFQTGDILIYTNTNDKEIIKDEYITYENGTYAYIYIEGTGFVGVNTGNGKVNGHGSDRNEFNANYYSNNLKLYKENDSNKEISPIEDSTFFNSKFLNNQTLLGKDYYVILRPAINLTCN